MKRLPAVSLMVALIFIFTSGSAFAADGVPPTMETIFESEGLYYSTAPTFSNFGFDADVNLDDGWYQIDSFAGAWI